MLLNRTAGGFSAPGAPFLVDKAGIPVVGHCLASVCTEPTTSRGLVMSTLVYGAKNLTET